MLTRALLCLFLVTSVACSTPLETVRLPGVGPLWVVGDMQDFGKGKGTRAEYVPVGQPVGGWTRHIEIQFLEGSTLSPEEGMQAFRKQMVATCPQVSWIIVDSDRRSITYEWRLEDCNARDDQHELVRILRGNDGLHLVSYGEMRARMDLITRDLWLDRLEAAVVIKGDDQDVVEVR